VNSSTRVKFLKMTLNFILWFNKLASN